MATREELLCALIDRYGKASRSEKSRIVSEFAAVTGYHRKHAGRLLCGARKGDERAPVSDLDLLELVEELDRVAILVPQHAAHDVAAFSHDFDRPVVAFDRFRRLRDRSSTAAVADGRLATPTGRRLKPRRQSQSRCRCRV